MKIAVICTETSGFTSLDAVRKSHEITGIGVPDLSPDAIRQHLSFSQYSGLPLVQLTKSRLREDLFDWFRRTTPDVLLVFGFPWRLPVEPLAQLRHGGFNVHYGALPQYRGPQPVFWAMREMAPSIGLTIHRVDPGLDTGPIAVRRSVPAVSNDTHGFAMARMAGPATEAVLELVDRLDRQTLVLEAQDSIAGMYHPRATDADLSIRWESDSANAIGALVRAANPFHGGAITKLRNNDLRIWQMAAGPLPGNAPPAGTIIAANPQQGLITVSRDGFWIRLDIVSIREGLFSGEEFAARIGIQPGEKLTT